MHLLRKPQCVVDGLLDPGSERDRRGLAGRRIDFPDPALAPDDDRLAVRRPRVLGIQAVNGPCFLQVLVDIAEELAVAAALDVPQVQRALQSNAPDVRKRPSVRRHLRSDKSALDADGAALATGHQVAPHHGVNGAVRILVVLEGLTLA